MNPAMLSHDSPMPAYAYLFADERGEALLAYMRSLGETNVGAHLEMTQQTWRLANTTLAAAQRLDGAALLQKNCATCHASDGLTRKTWKGRFNRLPPDLVAGPLVYVPTGMPTDWRLHRIAEIIKFGLAGTDMPGHEYLTDDEVAAMATQVIRLAESKGQKSAVGKNGL
jgi:cytochrome c oxidase cbb3-type subunit 2